MPDPEPDLRTTEIHCHGCRRYVRFQLDHSLDGNHVVKCPRCGHEHCRVIYRGHITGDRWDSRNSNRLWITSAVTYVSSMYTANSCATSTIIMDSWATADSASRGYFSATCS